MSGITWQHLVFKNWSPLFVLKEKGPFCKRNDVYSTKKYMFCCDPWSFSTTIIPFIQAYAWCCVCIRKWYNETLFCQTRFHKSDIIIEIKSSIVEEENSRLRRPILWQQFIVYSKFSTFLLWSVFKVNKLSGSSKIIIFQKLQRYDIQKKWRLHIEKKILSYANGQTFTCCKWWFFPPCLKTSI